MKVKAQTRGSAAVPASKGKDGKDIPAQPAIPARGPVEVEVNIPEDLDGQVKLFGKDVVAAHAQGSLVISLQALMRRMLDAGKTPADIQKAASEWKPDTKSTVRQSAFEKASSSLDKLTPEERKQLLSKLQGLK